MSELPIQTIFTPEGAPQIPVGERVNVVTKENGKGFDVVPDPEGMGVVISCDPGLIRVQWIEDAK